MFTLRCTQKLLARVKPPAEAPAVATTKLGDWYCNIFDVRPGPLVLCMSEKTFLCSVIPLDYFIHRPDVMSDCVARLLIRQGIPREAVEAERREMQRFQFGATASKRVLGCLNNAMVAVQYSFERADRIETVEDFLARYIYSTNNYVYPVTAALAAFGVVQ